MCSTQDKSELERVERRVAPKPSSRSPRQRLVARLSYKPPKFWILHKLFKCNFRSFIMSKTKSSRSKEKLFFSRQKELFFAPRYSVASVMIMIYYTGPWQKKRYVWNRWAINTGWSRMLKMKTKNFGFWRGKLVLRFLGLGVVPVRSVLLCHLPKLTNLIMNLFCRPRETKKNAPGVPTTGRAFVWTHPFPWIF